MTSFANMIGVLVACCLLITGLQGFSTGADHAACNNNAMVPTGHGSNNAYGTPSPYNVTVSALQYSAGEALTG